MYCIVHQANGSLYTVSCIQCEQMNWFKMFDDVIEMQMTRVSKYKSKHWNV